MKFEMNVPTLVDTNDTYNFYIEKCSSRVWYVIATAKTDSNRRTLASFTTKRVAFECVEAWKSWMK